MFYIDVLWHHTCPEDPVRLVSELDDNRWETRKIEFFSDGRVGIASMERCTLDTALGLMPVPVIDEINADGAFTASAIDKQAFELLWLEHSCTQDSPT
jgi:hypothetical protein